MSRAKESLRASKADAASEVASGKIATGIPTDKVKVASERIAAILPVRTYIEVASEEIAAILPGRTYSAYGNKVILKEY